MNKGLDNRSMLRDESPRCIGVTVRLASPDTLEPADGESMIGSGPVAALQ